MNTGNANGNRFDRQGYEAACERMRSAPMTLTSHDFAQLENVSPVLVAQAHQLRRVAQMHREPALLAKAPTRTRATSVPTTECMTRPSLRWRTIGSGPIRKASPTTTSHNLPSSVQNSRRPLACRLCRSRIRR